MGPELAAIPPRGGKIDRHKGELFPRVGFIVTNLRRPPWRVVKFHNGRGTGELEQITKYSRREECLSEVKSMKTYSMDLRERVLAACDAREGTRREIAERFAVSESWVYFLLKRRRETGEIGSWDAHAGRKPVFEGQRLERLKALVEEHPDATLEELCVLSGQDCSVMAVQRALRRLGASRKKNTSRGGARPPGRSRST